MFWPRNWEWPLISNPLAMPLDQRLLSSFLSSFHMWSLISMIHQHVAPFQINDYDGFRDLGFVSFNSETLLSSLPQYSRVDNLLTCVPLGLTVNIFFGSPDFGDFESQLLVSSVCISFEWKIYWNLSSLIQWLSSISRLFPSSISDFSFFLLIFPLSILPRACDIVTLVLSQIDGSQLLRLFEIW